MSQPVYIEANQFMKLLQDNDLVIARRKDVLTAQMIEQNQLLSQKDLSLSEVIKAKLFVNVRSTETLRRWCHSGKFGKEGYYALENGQIRILTTAIKKLLYGK